MTKKQRRLIFIASTICIAGLAAFLVLSAMRESIVFFFSPSDVIAETISPTQTIRIGGLVAEGTVGHGKDDEVTFDVTDLENTLTVTYVGILPDLFREGQGVVAEGKLGPDGVFAASRILAKHDENYLPKEVSDALKEAGHWQEPGSESSEYK